MSVGVDAIDNDHRRLLETINEINDAITAGKTADVIEEIFSRLERYVVEHFTREEALMEQSGFQELEPHKRQHQKFVGRVPQLKAKLLSADTMEVALEVSLFLTNWLMNHVIMEDICRTMIGARMGCWGGLRSGLAAIWCCAGASI